MIPLSPYAVLQAIVNDEASPLETPDGHVFSQRFVEATAVLSAYGDGNQATNAALCAFGLASWTPEARAAFLEKFDVPGTVYQRIAAPGDWPFAPVEPVAMPPMPSLPGQDQ